MTAPVVVGVDGSESAKEAVRWAAREAKRRNTPLRLVHAELPLPVEAAHLDGRVRRELHQQAWQWVHEAAAVARRVDPAVMLDAHLEVSDPVPLLAAESEKAGLLVLGSRGLGGFGSLLLGSTAVGVTGRADCAVVVVRGEGVADGPVVCGLTDSPTSEAVVARAYQEALARGVGVVAVHAWHPPLKALAQAIDTDLGEVDAARGGMLAHHIAPWREEHPGVPVGLVVERGSASAVLVDRARTASLVVVGSRGRGALTGLLLGSTSQALLHHADCPVLVLPPSREVS